MSALSAPPGSGAVAAVSTPPFGGSGVAGVADIRVAGALSASYATAKPSKGKKQRCRWLEPHDMMAVHAVRAANAHVTPRGTNTKRFEEAADIFNGHPQAPFRVDGKAVHDRFDLITERFLKKDKEEAARTGVEAKETELESIMQDMTEAAEDHQRREESARKDKKDKLGRLDATGDVIRTLTMERRRNRP